MKKSLQLFITFFIAIGLLAACGGNNKPEQTANNEQETDASFPVTITDALDNEVTLEAKPERIVSLIPSNTETLFALGLNEEIVGVSDYDNYPEEAMEKEKVGGMEFNIEQIISLEPDVVFAHASSAHNSEEGLNQLRDANIQVIVVNEASSFADAYRSIDMIATVTGTKDKGDDMIEMLKAKVTEIEEKVKGIQPEDEVNVWVEVEAAPSLYTTGKNTFIDEMLTIIRANNVARDQEGWIQFTEEDAVKLNPDVIVTTYGDYVENSKEQILAREAWSDVPAVKNERVYDVNADLLSRPGPRLAEGIEELAKVIYPEIFAK